MKIVKFCIMLFTAALFSLSAAEDVLACYTNAAWKVPSWSPFYAIDDFLGIRGYVMITSKRSFEIDSDAEYEISGTFRSPDLYLAGRRAESAGCYRGGVVEWSKAQHWKCCVRATVPWVRIPPPPPFLCLNCGKRCRLVPFLFYMVLKTSNFSYIRE